MYYDREGKPLTLMEWGRLFEQQGYKRVAETTVCEGVWVSTVWLGMDHSWLGPPPLIFETMVFVELEHPMETPIGTFGWDGTETQRYTTEAQALAGHDQLVAELRATFTIQETHETKD